MSPTASLQDPHSNSNQKQSDRRPHHLLQPQSTHQGYSKLLDTLPQMPGVGKRSMEETNLSSADHLTVDKFEGSYTRLASTTATSLEAPNVAAWNEHQDSRAPYQNRTDPWDPAPNTTMFQNAHGFNISGRSHFLNIANVNQLSNMGESQGFVNFQKFVSFNALHDSSAQESDRQIHPVLRKNTLKQLQDWINSPIVTEHIIWLHGPASIGKTAIALEIARTGREKVAATFFFSRTDASRNDGSRLVPTLAWQFTVSIPDIKNHITHSINERPDLPNKGIEAQFEYLIAQPFAAMKGVASAAGLSDLVVIIDGIDECADIRVQRKILQVIGNAIQDRRVPLRFIIFSRPDSHIRETFDQFQTPSFCVDLAKFNLAEDIRRREEEIGKREEEIKKREEEVGKREEEIRKREERIEKKEEEITFIIPDRQSGLSRSTFQNQEFTQAPDRRLLPYAHPMPISLPSKQQDKPNDDSQPLAESASRSSSPGSGISTNVRREGFPRVDIPRISRWLDHVEPLPPSSFPHELPAIPTSVPGPRYTSPQSPSNFWSGITESPQVIIVAPQPPADNYQQPAPQYTSPQSPSNFWSGITESPQVIIVAPQPPADSYQQPAPLYTSPQSPSVFWSGITESPQVIIMAPQPPADSYRQPAPRPLSRGVRRRHA